MAIRTIIPDDIIHNSVFVKTENSPITITITNVGPGISARPGMSARPATYPRLGYNKVTIDYLNIDGDVTQFILPAADVVSCLNILGWKYVVPATVGGGGQYEDNNDYGGGNNPGGGWGYP